MPQERLTPGDDPTYMPIWGPEKLSPTVAETTKSRTDKKATHRSDKPKDPKSIDLAIFVTALRRRPSK